ncbi:MAG: hypothetical protein ACK5HR_05705 [Mycoplasmatales bacterium]
MKQDSVYLLNLYLKSKEYAKELENIDEIFKKAKVDIKLFEELCNDQLEEVERDVMIKYHLEQKSLKKIAHEHEYSYPYIRKIYITAKEKMRIILSVTMANNAKKLKK